MRLAADLDENLAVAGLFHNRDMLFITGIYGVRNEFLHLFTAAHDGNLRVNHLVDDVAAMAASIKNCSHKS